MSTLGRKLGASFLVPFALVIGVGVVTLHGVTGLGRAYDLVERTHGALEAVDGALSGLRMAEASQRGYLITDDDTYLPLYGQAAQAARTALKKARLLAADSPGQRARLETFDGLLEARLNQLSANAELRARRGMQAVAVAVERGNGRQSMAALEQLAADARAEETALLQRRTQEVEEVTARVRLIVIAGALSSLVFVCATATALIRALSRQIGGAAGEIRSASTKLEVVSRQQAFHSKESADVVAEITSTAGELTSASRQVSERASQIAHAADRASSEAQEGAKIVQSAVESMDRTRTGIDQVVLQALLLGKRSQEAESILEIIEDLSERTNVIAINAMIEAAGAGEAGKRFSVVAAEIRSLVDRVVAASRRIREVVDDVRGTVNTTIMVTEQGSKAVEEGTRHFSLVLSRLGDITDTVRLAAHSSREIELVTTEQAKAVEQLNAVIIDAARAARDVESSSGQTSLTAAGLSTLSKQLSHLVQAGRTPGRQPGDPHGAAAAKPRWRT